MNNQTDDESPSIPQKKRRTGKAKLGRHRRKKQQKARLAEHSVVSQFPPVSQSTDPVAAPTIDESAATTPSSLVKSILNKADYRKRKYIEKDGQVKELHKEICQLKESSREEEEANVFIQAKLQDQLTNNKASSSKVIETLQGRVTRLSTSLLNTKGKHEVNTKSIIKEHKVKESSFFKDKRKADKDLVTLKEKMSEREQNFDLLEKDQAYNVSVAVRNAKLDERSYFSDVVKAHKQSGMKLKSQHMVSMVIK